MVRDQLIAKLNNFYNLELFQVDLYLKQSKTVDDILIATTLERFAAVEQEHVDNIGEKIKDLGGKPAVIQEFVAPIAGKVFGQISGLPGLASMYKLNIKLEEKAMQDYRQLIVKVGSDQGLVKLLWYNMVDEDTHKTWFAAELEKIKNHS